MSIKRTPDLAAPVRSLYERRSQEGDTINCYMIQLDTAIDSLQRAFAKGDITQKNTSEALQELRQFTDTIFTSAERIATTTYVDYCRLAHSAALAEQRVMVPLIFGRHADDSGKALREAQADGIVGCSTYIIADMLSQLDESKSLDEQNRKCIRGALQELTMTALLNDPQDGGFIVLPAGYYDDVCRGIDAYAFFIADDGRPYHARISYKSSDEQAALAKQKHPDYIVLSAARINNLSLHISRLLARRDAGSPGLTTAETDQLAAARAQLYHDFCEQITSGSATYIGRE